MGSGDEVLQHLLDDPTDAGRLLVYSDWLRERDDPRADYAVRQLELRTTDDPARVRSELRELYPVDRPMWVGRLELAGVFEPRLIDIEELWWGVGIGARDTNATYQGFSYTAQPPIPFDRFDGSFAWLPSTPARNADDRALAAAWTTRIADLRERGFQVPTAFERFMASPELWALIPSCTDNYFMQAPDTEAHPQPDGSLFLTFYSDSQACVLWGIRLGHGDDRYAPVLAGAPEWPDEEPEPGSSEPYFRFPDLTFSAPTFESFVYRWWIENRIWYATNLDEHPLDDDERAYLAHLEQIAAARADAST